MPDALCYFARQAWVEGRWQSDVRLSAGEDGSWIEVRPGANRKGAQLLPGPVLPGLVDAHGHAFQRALAGLTERSAPGQDDFWSWRDAMYRMSLRITPGQLEAVAAFVYAELLRAGYTQVCEFHYLHNDPDGRPYADPMDMSMALVRAAQRVGMGLTLLPTLYMRAGFGDAGLQADQRRFASVPDGVLRIAEAVRRMGDATLTAGIALHSLRAVEEGALRECAQAARQADMPVHMHISEQALEVQQCLARHGATPIDWLAAHVPLDARWNLVHATHARKPELALLRRAGASIVICPSTEANLGDGIFDLGTWLAQGGSWSIGSDSHVTRSWMEELRLLEYAQRLVQRQRNVAARAAGAESTAAVLFEGALAGGSAAAGLPLGGLRVGQRADLMVLDADAPALVGLPASHVLDAAIFSSPEVPVRMTMVAGRWVRPELPAREFREALRGWAGGSL